MLDNYGHKGPQILKTYTYDIMFRRSAAVKVVSGVEKTKTYEHTKPAAVPAYPVHQEREQFRKTWAPMKPVERDTTDVRILSW